MLLSFLAGIALGICFAVATGTVIVDLLTPKGSHRAR